MPGFRSRARALSERLECPTDNDGSYANTFWCNRDLIPIPVDRRTWTWQGFAGYWVIAGINTTSWTIGSTLFALGLSIRQAMAMVVVACLVIGVIAVLGGWAGSHQHIGFTVLCRSTWGMRGAFWPVLNRVLTGCVFMGIQIYWGGQSVRIMLNALIGPKMVFLANTLPESANVETADLICFFVFVVAMVPFLFVPPEHLQMPFRVAFVMIVAVLLGMLIWSLAAAHGIGDIQTGASSSSSGDGRILAWNMLYGCQSLLGGWSGGIMGQSDWTRYAKHRSSALFGQAVAAPITVCLTALFGILISSAASKLYGQIFWNPFLLLLYIQERDTLSAEARAGTFFAGLGLLASQIALCIVLNSVSAGMDLTTLFPRYINIKRGASIITLIGIAIVPWNFINSPSTFIVVLSGWSVFLSPMTGLLLADYFVVHRRRSHLSDLYVGNSTSIYWYTSGVNWRAVISWGMGLWPLLPGFVRSVKMQNTYSGWDNLYQINYFVGFSVSFTLHILLNLVFPVSGHSGESSFEFSDKGRLAELEDITSSDYVPNAEKNEYPTSSPASTPQYRSKRMACSIEIPKVDLGVFHDSSATAKQRQAAAILLAQACHKLGFVDVTNHGIADELVQEAFEWSKRLFGLPHADKMKAPHPPTAMPHRGYSAPGVEKVYSNDEVRATEGKGAQGEPSSSSSASLREVSDYKESYEIGSDQDPDQANIWLPEETLPGFRTFMTAFYWACNDAADVLLRALADGLALSGPEREALLRLNSHHCNQLRLLHYPEVDAGSLRANVVARMPAHTDWGSCTMLFQDGVGGLELRDPTSGEWVFARPTDGACIVNVGDFMERLTNGHFKSATHRVTLPQSQQDGTVPERYSIPYFIGPRSDMVGKCLDSFVTKERPAAYDPMTFTEYATWRAKYSYQERHS